MEPTVTIFLDANIIIYQVEGVEPFQQQVRNTLSDIVRQHPDAGFAVSRLSLLECLVKPVREQNDGAISRYRGFFASSDIRIIEVTDQVIETALVLRARHGLRTPDAIQAASALILKSQIIFLTGDRNFQKVPTLQVQLIS